MNIIETTLEGVHLKLGEERVPLTAEWLAQLKGYQPETIKLEIRPEDIRLTIKYVEDYGKRVRCYFDLGQEMIGNITGNRYQKGERVYWRLNPQKWYFFDATTDRSLGYPASWKEVSDDVY